MIDIRRNIDVQPMTTFGIHATAAAVAEYDTVEDLLLIIADKSLPRPLKHIGQGSNLLFTGAFTGTLLHSRDNSIADVTTPGERSAGRVMLRVAAGLPMDALCRYVAEQGLWGIENLSGIPGEVGAAPVQNVGAYGVEAADVIACVEAIDSATGQARTFTSEQMAFRYRDSIFKHDNMRGRYIVTHVIFALSTAIDPTAIDSRVATSLTSATPSPMDVRHAVIALRDSKLPDPKTVGSAGSFFKNPVVTPERYAAICGEYPDVNVPGYPQPDGGVKMSAAWLIDRCGLKGRQVGGAAVWTRQPLVIVNATGSATSADVVALMRTIIAEVEQRFAITLHPEVEQIN